LIQLKILFQNPNGVPGANKNPQGSGIKRCHNTQMIQGRLLPSSHLIAPNAKLKLRREPPFITGHHHAKCFAQVVVMHRIVSFSQVRLMKMSIMVQVILMPGKLREGEIPFLVVGRWKIRSPSLERLDQHLYLFKGSSFTLAVILTSSVLVMESSFLDLVAFHFRYTKYSSVRSGYFSDPCNNDAQSNSSN